MCVDHTACMEEQRNEYKTLVTKSEGNSLCFEDLGIDETITMPLTQKTDTGLART